MEKVLRLASVNDYARYVGTSELHPHVSVVHYDELAHCRHALIEYGVYALFLMKESPYSITYGGGYYKFQSGSLMCVAPGQRGGVTDNGETFHIKGWALLFHPDLLSGTHLERRIKDYHYFSYYSNEALLLTTEEWARLERCIAAIRKELEEFPEDSHLQVRARTGESAILYIRHFLMRRAKEMLMEGLPVAEVSDTLGFAYPQHFTRMFKKEFNMAPSKIRY